MKAEVSFVLEEIPSGDVKQKRCNYYLCMYTKLTGKVGGRDSCQSVSPLCPFSQQTSESSEAWLAIHSVSVVRCFGGRVFPAVAPPNWFDPPSISALAVVTVDDSELVLHLENAVGQSGVQVCV